MSHNPGDAATTAREQETEQTQTPSAEPSAHGSQSAPSAQPTADAATATSQSSAEPAQSTGTSQPAQGNQASATQRSDNLQASAETRAETAQSPSAAQPQAGGADNQAQPAQTSAQSEAGNAPAASSYSSQTQAPSPVQSAASATPQPTGDPDEGVAGSANVNAETPAQQATREEFAPRPDMSNQDWQQLVPKLLALFNNNREQLGRALGLHRSTVDRWLNGKSRPNTSTILRMRRLAQERHVE